MFQLSSKPIRRASPHKNLALRREKQEKGGSFLLMNLVLWLKDKKNGRIPPFFGGEDWFSL
jgi:hypothetical protein